MAVDHTGWNHKCCHVSRAYFYQGLLYTQVLQLSWFLVLLSSSHLRPFLPVVCTTQSVLPGPCPIAGSYSFLNFSLNIYFSDHVFRMSPPGISVFFGFPKDTEPEVRLDLVFAVYLFLSLCELPEARTKHMTVVSP